MNEPLPHPATLLLPTNRAPLLGRLLLELGKITPHALDRVLLLQKEVGLRFGEAARELGLVTEADVQQALARQFGYAYLQPGDGRFSEELATAYRPFSAEVEAIRALRIQLRLGWFASGQKSLAVLGAAPEHGGSVLAANLAVAFSQLGERTLLIDANLRCPRQHQIFHLSHRPGLSDVLAGRAGLEAIVPIEPFGALSVLPAGTQAPNPQELFHRAAFGDLMECLAARFDVILFDVPACSQGADALAIAARAAGVLFIARKHETRMAELRGVTEQIGRTGAQVVGAVLVEF
jgi:protein-tyrosine kinase